MTITQQQHLLAYLGYAVGAADGICGAQTTQAVRAFQKEYGDLTVDGLAGAKTCAALVQAVADGWERPDAVSDSDTTGGTFWDEIQYFERKEFKCKCGGKYCDGYPAEPAEALVRAVDEIRRRLGIPVTISSGLRCAQHNANEGGVSNSQHLYGIAADLHASTTPAKMKEVAEAVLGSTGGIGLYSWGIHVDVRDGCARWEG